YLAITSTNRFLPNVTTTYEIRSSDDARSDVASWGSVGDNDESSSTITAGTSSNTNLSPSLRSTNTTNGTTSTITTITNPSNSTPSPTTSSSSSSSSSVLEIDVL